MFADELQKSDAPSASHTPVIARITTGKGVLEKLTSRPFRLSRETAIDRLRGLLIGPDGESTCVIVSVSDAGLSDQRAVVRRIRDVAKEHCGLEATDLHLGGTAAEAAAIAEESEDTLRNYTLPVTVVTLIVAWLCLRQLRLLIAIGAAAAYCRFMTMAAAWYTGTTLSAVLIVAPVLTYVLTMSGAVHLVNYYRDAVRESGPDGAAWKSLNVGWKPCALAAFTTSLGLVSLAVSQTAPIREFGFYSSACLMVSLVVMLGAVPMLLHLWPGQPLATDSAKPKSRPLGFSQGIMRVLPDLVIRSSRSVLLVSALILLVSGWGLIFTRASVQIQHLFRSDSRVIQDYTWIQERIGSVGTIEFLVRFDDASPQQFVNRYETVRRTDEQIRQVPGVDATVSAATFLPPPVRSAGPVQLVRKAAWRRQLLARRQMLCDERLLAEDGDGEVWRISVRRSALETNGGRELAEHVLQAIRESHRMQAPRQPFHCSYTGLLPLVESAQEVLLMDLVRSVAFALLLICPTMVLLLRDLRAGLLAMIPNVAPIVIVFGIMGWWGQPVDAGSLLTASVAMGIAVDDTLHFLKWFRQGSAAGLTRPAAIHDAFRRCAPAMVQTTLICGIGLLLLIDSYFVPTQRFAVLLFLLLMTALPGDLILLPALLASPAGRFFEVDRTSPPHKQPSVAE